MIWVRLLLACGGASDTPAEPLPEAADKATFATVAGLGSHHLHTEVTRTTSGGAAGPLASTESLDLRWSDADHWSIEQSRDGRVLSKVVVWDAVAWSSDGDRPLARKGDAEPYRVQLAQTWDPWSFALESLADQLSLQRVGVELMESRRVVHHTVTLAPPPARVRRGWTATSATGEVWIDEATAVRMKGDVHVVATSGKETREVALAFAVDGLGLDPGVSPPGGDKP